MTVQSCREEKLHGLGHHSSFKYPPFWRISRFQLRKGQWKPISFFPQLLLHCIYEPSKIQTSMQDENGHIWHFWASTYSGCPQTIFSPFCLVIKLFEARDSFLACKAIWRVPGKFLISNMLLTWDRLYKETDSRWTCRKTLTSGWCHRSLFSNRHCQNFSKSRRLIVKRNLGKSIWATDEVAS